MNEFSTLHGVLNIDKPAGMTSHDVVDRIRNAAKVTRVGHTGTLDPMATGVLPICIGRATKIQQFLVAQDKEYDVEMTLGVITDSQDLTGNVVEELPVPAVDETQVLNVFERFRGEQLQVPPMISAKHHKGKRLYQLARKGVEVKREPCRIFIHRLELLELRLPVIRYLVVCGKGTYIRTLCHDLGKALGSGAAMSNLSRTRCGSFAIEDSVKLDDLKTPENVRAVMRPMDDALAALPSVTVAPHGRSAIVNGRGLLGGEILRRSGEFETGAFIRVKTRDGALLGVGQALMGSHQLDDLAGNLRVIRPVKIFQ